MGIKEIVGRILTAAPKRKAAHAKRNADRRRMLLNARDGSESHVLTKVKK